MMRILNKKFIVATCIVIGILFSIPISVSASNQISINGTATVISTGGTFDFDEYNSNVIVDSDTGDLSGYVWSQDLGWIDFDNNGNPNPASVDLVTGKVSGLAYAENTTGIIDFTNFHSNTIVDLGRGGISGYAWSHDLGWIDFENVQISGPLSQLPETGRKILFLLIIIIFSVSLLITKKAFEKYILKRK